MTFDGRVHVSWFSQRMVGVALGAIVLIADPHFAEAHMGGMAMGGFRPSISVQPRVGITPGRNGINEVSRGGSVYNPGRGTGTRMPIPGRPGPVEVYRLIRGRPIVNQVPLLPGPNGPNLGNGGPGVPPLGRRFGGANGFGLPPPGEARYVPDEVVVEFVGAPSPQTFAAMAARHRLMQLDTQNIALTNTTWVRWHINDRRSVPVVVRALAADGTVRWAQPNYLFTVQEDDQTAKPEIKPETQRPDDRADDAGKDGDPAQYALAKLQLIEAQTLTRGDRVAVAVIDTEIDKANPELAGAIADSFDAIGVSAPMEPHGTGIAGIIAAHARLLGAAPDVRLLAVRALGGGQGTTFSIIKGIDWATAHDARVINMSFAGPSDPAMGFVLAAAYDKGATLVAAVGNKGPKSPALYPAADRHVIAVTATDAHDQIFPLANRGSQVAIAAPGVDILVAAPENTYVMSSGTSMASAYASGVAALLVGRKPDLKPDDVKRVITTTAHALGAKGRDNPFGAGLIDANSAILAVTGRPAAELKPPPTQ